MLSFRQNIHHACHLSTLHFYSNFTVKYRIHLKTQIPGTSKAQLRFRGKEKLCETFRSHSTEVVLRWQNISFTFKVYFYKNLYRVFDFVFTFRVRIYCMDF